MADSPQSTHLPPPGNLTRRSFFAGLVGAAAALGTVQVAKPTLREELNELLLHLEDEELQAVKHVLRATLKVRLEGGAA